ncbi:hypothetical protein PILCRDRAFT_727413 [Piloderma croceum F 1598]|uniref:Uncharacterized protein n=1 Tax=Piloderma croceum (strain F 1598) TaxID=765440 RepID=A0A0C3B840_PILCF|nr:hypothetical protein PILCRDRAFT_727413 [Piloderma croceum F 1598]
MNERRNIEAIFRTQDSTSINEQASRFPATASSASNVQVPSYSPPTILLPNSIKLLRAHANNLVYKQVLLLGGCLRVMRPNTIEISSGDEGVGFDEHGWRLGERLSAIVTDLARDFFIDWYRAASCDLYS